MIQQQWQQLVCWCCCRLLVQVFPKMLDLYLLVLYASMVPVVYLQHRWLHVWIMVYHSAAVAGFMWVSVHPPVLLKQGTGYSAARALSTSYWLVHSPGTVAA
jgi:hypothetical protein